VILIDILGRQNDEQRFTTHCVKAIASTLVYPHYSIDVSIYEFTKARLASLEEEKQQFGKAEAVETADRDLTEIEL
jgi:hypothetical protein